ncbi:Oxidoreductase molybdopterin binding domain-containing protein [Methanococcoides vulcani]|uniref:Oxidoreductase molybdopterin binding domain-containing protein n=1 Tax=Methanococcoides vulcani TaxID=1353158 RepID=A0A1I0AFB4_9EURY|nr:molybdopterin-dependent oxidoreductase [Methanococcoides vulcani]SES92928.1 Oxidoreductase molybdopterin binding domain-containing protein [Methanococcoides vulcani]
MKWALTAILVFLVSLVILSSGCVSSDTDDGSDGTYGDEVETLEYQGVELTPISEQRNNAIKGTQRINDDTYLLRIGGMVDNPRSFTYGQVTSYPNVSKVVILDCVEGWGFTAKWTGVPVKLLLDEAGVQDGATTVIFYSEDGYSTALDLDYLVDNNIILGYKLNDVTLPQDRGFPFQLVAEGKYGYKWAKWITGIEVTDEPYEGYWETRGYNNNADVGGPRFG